MVALPHISLALAMTLPAATPVEPRSPLQMHSEFTILVHAPPQAALGLFGASGERTWAGKEWNPRFLEPRPEEDRPGAVFFFSPTSGRPILGYTPIFDREQGHIRHVFFRGSGSVTVIDVRLSPVDGHSSRVVVVYERTALDHDSEAEVRALAADDASQAAEWEAAINAYLSSIHREKP